MRRSTWRSWGSHASSRASTSVKLPTKLPQQTSSKSGSLWTVSTLQLGEGNGESFGHKRGLLQDKHRSVSGFGLYNLKGRALRKLFAIRHSPQATICALNLVIYKKRLGEVWYRETDRERETERRAVSCPCLSPLKYWQMPCFHSLIFGWTVAWRESSPRQQGEIRKGSAAQSNHVPACTQPSQQFLHSYHSQETRGRGMCKWQGAKT